MINGWIITGFPKNSTQVDFLKKNLNFTPSLVVLIGLDDEYIQKRSSSRRLDTSTGTLSFNFL
jgi:adenylate kinase family enzyme